MASRKFTIDCCAEQGRSCQGKVLFGSIVNRLNFGEGETMVRQHYAAIQVLNDFIFEQCPLHKKEN